MARTGRPCRVCEHPRRQEIDAALRNGALPSTLSLLHGIGESNIRRHKKNHLVLGDELAPPAGEPVPTEGEPAKMVRLLVLKAMRVARDAEAAGNPAAALRALRTVGDQLANVAKVKAAEPPAYDALRDEVVREIRDRVAAAVRPFPEAAAALAAAFREDAGR